MLLFDDNLIAANGTVAHYGGGMSDDALSLSVTKLYPTTKDPPLQYYNTHFSPCIKQLERHFYGVNENHCCACLLY